MKHLAFPFHFDGRGRTALAADEDHIRQMIEQVIFTGPGERLNRPDFGSGLLQLAFAPDSPELAGAVQFTLQASLQRWLGDLIELRAVEVNSSNAGLRIEVQYVVRRSQQTCRAQFTAPTAIP